MSYSICHRLGGMESEPPLSDLPALYDELDSDDTEHTDVSLTHESEWCLSASRDGTLIWENLGAGSPRHMTSVSRERTLALWARLAQGDLAAIEREPWRDGYP